MTEAADVPLGTAYLASGLTYELAGSDKIKGYWAFADATGHLLDDNCSFMQATAIFHGAPYTRFEIRAAAPEPQNWLLMTAGLGPVASLAIGRCKRA